MQVISGIYKNHPLKSPNDDKTHPMGSREKLALFNMISPYLEDALVLDAFAGSGALGIEALSRGAQRVIFVEKSGKIAKTIKENLENLGEDALQKSTIIVKDIDNFIITNKLDLIFADPPYNLFDTTKISPLGEYLKPNGILVLSHPGEAPILPNLTLQKSHSYAAATISIYQK